jgi:hypothetical protein
VKAGVFAASAVAVLAFASSGLAGWGSGGNGSGAPGAKNMPGGNTPTATLALTSVTVSWSASAFGGGPNVEGYVVKRYSGLGGGAQAPGGSCAGTVSGTNCSDSGISPGGWTYTVTPVQGSWHGSESAQSNSVVKL